MPNKITDISKTLERQYILRKFNETHLEMETSSGSLVNQIIGVGRRVDQESGESLPVTSFYPSFFRNVAFAFEQYPIQKYFGLTVETAMALPLDQWYHIRKVAKTIKESQTPESDPLNMQLQMFQIMKEMMGLLLEIRGGGG